MIHSDKLWISVVTALLLLALSSCGNLLHQTLPEENSQNVAFTPQVSKEFLYQTMRPVAISISAPFGPVPVRIESQDEVLYSGWIDSEGDLSTSIMVPISLESLNIATDYLGLLPFVEVPIINNSLSYNYLSPPLTTPAGESGHYRLQRSTVSFPAYSVIGGWNTQGVPDYLDSRVVIGVDFLNRLNDALPEYAPVPEENPHYLSETTETEIRLMDEASVKVTFVHEGAGYRNSLAYFTYNTGDSPPDELNPEDLTLIFPNVSYAGGGGGLVSGDTVNLGVFPAGTVIGWALIANGYVSQRRTVSAGLNTFSTREDLNPDSEPYQQHVVQIDFGDRIVLSFEDLLRPGGDQDFNDAIFSITANPLTAVETQNIVGEDDEPAPSIDEPGTQVPVSTFGEAVSSVYTPSQNGFGTLAFEDLWPYKGDYDFNDLVIDYNIEETLDIHGRILGIKARFIIKGILASMRNGFGFQLGTRPQSVHSVSGGLYSRGYIVRQSNGVEARQDQAVIIAFEDAHLHYDPDTDQEEIVLEIIFRHPVERSVLGYAPYNPFIMSNGERGREVHLPGYPATSLAHQEYFGFADDSSIQGSTKMYKSSDDQPWAIHLPESFSYPQDDISISAAYPYFTSWVESRGARHPDWYQDNPGFRIVNLLFTQ